MNPQLHTMVGLLQQQEATTGTDEVDIVCGNQTHDARIAIQARRGASTPSDARTPP